MRLYLSYLVTIAFLISLLGCNDHPEEPEEPFDPIDYEKEIDQLVGYETLSQLIPKRNGGYIIAGGGGSPAEILIYNIDGEGNLLWRKGLQVESYNNPKALSICEVNPEKYLISTYLVAPDTSNFLIGVLQMDQDGNITKLLANDLEGSPGWSRIYSDGNGGFFLAYLEHIAWSAFESETHFVLKHYDANNREQWSSSIDELYWQPDMCRAANGDFLIIGSIYPDPSDIQNLNIAGAKINSNGTLAWVENFGGNSWDVGLSLTESDNTGMLLAGKLTYENKPVLYKLDANGNLEKQRVLSDTMRIFHNEVHLLPSEGYLVTNLYLHDKKGGRNINMMKMDSSLKIKWSYNYEFNHEHLKLVDLIVLPDGSSAMAVLEAGKLSLIKTKPL